MTAGARNDVFNIAFGIATEVSGTGTNTRIVIQPFGSTPDNTVLTDGYLSPVDPAAAVSEGIRVGGPLPNVGDTVIAVLFSNYILVLGAWDTLVTIDPEPELEGSVLVAHEVVRYRNRDKFSARARITWVPVNVDLTEVSNLFVDISPLTDDLDSNFVQLGATVTTTTFQPLDLGTTYTVTVTYYTPDGIVTGTTVFTTPIGSANLSIDCVPNSEARSIRVSWDSIGLIAPTYTVTRDGVTIATSGTSYNDTGLEPGTTYTYAVAVNARNLDDVPPFTNPVSIQCALEDEPDALEIEITASGITETSVTLGWLASGGNDDRYRYRLERDGQVLLNNTASLNYTNTGLTADTEYTFLVTVTDADGDQASASVTVTTRAEPANIINSFGATTLGTDRIRLNWDVDVPDDVTLVLRRGTTVITPSGGISGTGTIVDSGLEADTEYTYTLTGNSETDNSPATASAATRAEDEAEAVENVSISSAVNSDNPYQEVDVTYSWDGDATSAVITVTTVTELGPSTVTTLDVLEGDGLHTFTGLSVNTSYTFTLVVVGEESDNRITATDSTRTRGITAPTNLVCITESRSFIQIGFDSSLGSEGTHTVQYREKDSNNWLAAGTPRYNAREDRWELTRAGVTSGSTYEFRVRSTHAGITTAWSSILECTASATDAPDLTIEETGIVDETAQQHEFYVDFSWTEVTGATSYDLRYREVDSTTWLTTTATRGITPANRGTADSPFRITGLRVADSVFDYGPDTRIEAQIKANNTGWSETVRAPMPSRPSNLTLNLIPVWNEVRAFVTGTARPILAADRVTIQVMGTVFGQSLEIQARTGTSWAEAQTTTLIEQNGRITQETVGIGKVRSQIGTTEVVVNISSAITAYRVREGTGPWVSINTVARDYILGLEINTAQYNAISATRNTFPRARVTGQTPPDASGTTFPTYEFSWIRTGYTIPTNAIHAVVELRRGGGRSDIRRWFSPEAIRAVSVSSLTEQPRLRPEPNFITIGDIGPFDPDLGFALLGGAAFSIIAAPVITTLAPGFAAVSLTGSGVSLSSGVGSSGIGSLAAWQTSAAGSFAVMKGSGGLAGVVVYAPAGAVSTTQAALVGAGFTGISVVSNEEGDRRNSRLQARMLIGTERLLMLSTFNGEVVMMSASPGGPGVIQSFNLWIA